MTLSCSVELVRHCEKCRKSSIFIVKISPGISKNLFDTCVFWSCVTRCGCRTTSSTLFTVYLLMHYTSEICFAYLGEFSGQLFLTRTTESKMRNLVTLYCRHYRCGVKRGCRSEEYWVSLQYLLFVVFKCQYRHLMAWGGGLGGGGGRER